jgi:hypothetical protein
VQGDQQIQIMRVAICLVIIRYHMNLLFINDVKILMLPIMFTIDLRIVSTFDHVYFGVRS